MGEKYITNGDIYKKGNGESGKSNLNIHRLIFKSSSMMIFSWLQFLKFRLYSRLKNWLIPKPPTSLLAHHPWWNHSNRNFPRMCIH